MKGFVEGCSTFFLEAVCVHIENLALFHTFKVQIFYYNDISVCGPEKKRPMELFVSKYFFLHLYIQFQFFTKNNRFFTVFINILNILNICIDLLSLLRNREDC